ncbi:hypothetical protein JHK87_016481 [Glycine soja]|nr:hypothetical protein JHK87_016481 [Glycine soja]
MEYESIQSVIVGSEIPRWFNIQHVDSLMSIDTSPVMHDNNWIGVVCGAIFLLIFSSYQYLLDLITVNPSGISP